jgi:hypothetical protein
MDDRLHEVHFFFRLGDRLLRLRVGAVPCPHSLEQDPSSSGPVVSSPGNSSPYGWSGKPSRTVISVRIIFVSWIERSGLSVLPTALIRARGQRRLLFRFRKVW